jgi:putative DNA primase/helicase
MTGTQDTLTAFRAVMDKAGIIPAKSIDPTRGLIRFDCKGDTKGRKNGWAILHLDGAVPSGMFGNWREGSSHKWRAGGEVRALTDAERFALMEHTKRREAERLAGQDRARVLARELYRESGRADPAHPYLVRKGIAGHGLRQRGYDLIAPMIDADYRLHNIQRIGSDGTKRFAKGARVSGLFWLAGGMMLDCGNPNLGPVVIAEGVATAAAIREATGFGTVAAMSCGNLLPVARTIRRMIGGRPIIIAADWDGATTGNPGLTAAREAAQRVAGKLACPTSPGANRASLNLSVDFADIPRDECARLIRAAKGVDRG